MATLPQANEQRMLDVAPALARNGMRLPFDAARLPHWMRFERRDFGLVIVLVTLITVVNASGAIRLLHGRSLLEIAEFIGTVWLDAALIWIALVAALKAAEKLSIKGWRRHLTTVAIGITVSALISAPQYFLEWPYAAAGLKFEITSSAVALLLNLTWQNSALALIARAWLVKSQEEARVSKLLSDIRAEQMSVRRRLVEGRLKALQARVDPLLFFDMLESVQKMYTIDSSRAEQLLDELTTFLRAALPRLRTASSTIDQECDLARSFARLRTLAGRGQSRLEVEIAPAVGAASFPPGVLLPLIDELLRGTADADSVAITCLTNEPIRLSVMVQLTAGAQPSTDTLKVARATLLDLFGAAATLTSVAVDGVSRTTVEVPYELANA